VPVFGRIDAFIDRVDAFKPLKGKDMKQKQA
jgi:hypothetical protein